MKDYYDLDELTRKHTAFGSFLEFCADGYTPTIRFDGKNGNERRYLAGAYDAYQVIKGVQGNLSKTKRSYR